MLKKMLQLSVVFFTLIAFANVAAATSVIAYQPELPEELKDIE
ncbi:cyclic lactone autoinducer peptide [Sporosalibacterium faouarense]|nr:cyclic lactone autoinducer peptide [Sporosalibacterium faouarense]MTI48770.1 cyclic lactone autoinducer peptide [Bacillota bacterium]